MKKMTAGDVCEIAGISRSRLDRWAKAGALENLPQPEGKGNYRIYTTSQCLAIATAVRYCEAGASFERIVGIIQLLSAMPIEHIEAEIEAGRTFPVPATMLGLDWMPGFMIEPPPFPASMRKAIAQFDLPTVYKQVRQHIDRLADSMKTLPRQRGRQRGLATK